MRNMVGCCDVAFSGCNITENGKLNSENIELKEGKTYAVIVTPDMDG